MPRRKQAEPLSRERIVAAAIGLVDREGVGALSMRRLGKELGVDPMAVYYYLPNKEALLDAIVEAVMTSIDLTVDDPSKPAEDRIVGAARAYRDAMLAHVRALPIVLSHGPRTPASMRPVELLLGILREAGLSPSRAMAGMNAIAASVRGTMGMIDDTPPPSPEEQAALAATIPADEFPYLREAVACPNDFLNADFEFGIRALARGLLGSVGSQD